MNKHILRLVIGIPFLLATAVAYAQTDSLAVNIEDISLEDLMNVKIVSVSKKAENLFDAPLSASSVSREEIKRSGANSIMEALRLVPGVFVTENSKGNYNVSIRGLSNLPAQSSLNTGANSISLVMIDNRPVYNYFNGGTFWETLPVDLNDVEKIEVVRGPAAALYGPNAAAGVINIITRRAQKEGLYAVGNAQYGTSSQLITNASVGYKFKKFDFILSGNQQYRNRDESEYYSWIAGEKMSADSIRTSFPLGALFTDTLGNPNARERYPNRNLSMNKYGYNAFLSYAITSKSSLHLAAGGQNSTVQKPFIENLGTPFSTSLSNTQYVDLRGNFNHLSAQVSYQGGTQDAAEGFVGYKYDFRTLDANAEYDFVYKGLSVKPGVSYRTAQYDDSKYANKATRQGFLGGEKTLENFAGSLRSELNMLKKIKLTAALRLDKYNVPAKSYLSYQFGGNYKINERNVVRAVVSRAYKGPNMYDSYSSNNIFVGNFMTPMMVSLPYYAQVLGNTNLNMQNVDLVELGYRVKATDRLYFDLELFNQTTQNFTNLVGQPTAVDLVNGTVTIVQSVQNINLRAIQTGGTLSANLWLNKFQIKPFVTVQYTQLKNEPVYRDSDAANPTQNISVTRDRKDNGTPNVYGGAYINLAATSKLNFNISGYYFSQYTYMNLYNSPSLNADPTKGVANINSKVLINARVSYKFFNKLDVFVAAKNIMNQTKFEYAHTDIIRPSVLGGINFEF